MDLGENNRRSEISNRTHRSEKNASNGKKNLKSIILTQMNKGEVTNCSSRSYQQCCCTACASGFCWCRHVLLRTTAAAAGTTLLAAASRTALVGAATTTSVAERHHHLLEPCLQYLIQLSKTICEERGGIIP
jgi:hypothetical protein